MQVNGITVDDELVNAMWKSMSKPDFYGADMTLEFVEQRVRFLMEGNRPRSGPDMFIEGWLKKAGLL